MRRFPFILRREKRRRRIFGAVCPGRSVSGVKTVSGEEQHRRMTETPVFRLLVRLSLPTVAGQLVTVLYNTADTWFVSRISTSASAAVGVSFALMSIIQAIGYDFGMGAGSIISRKLGAEENESAEVCASSALFAAIFCGLLLSVVGLSVLKPLMRLLGSTETMLPYSCAYARYILLSAPIMCGAFVMNKTLSAEGETRFAMIGLCVGGFLNIALDPIFIYVLDYGIAGAALATAISQAAGFCVLLSQYLRKRSIIRLGFSKISRDISVYAEISATGLPTLFRQGLTSVATAILNGRAALFGDAAVAAMTIVYKVYSLVRSVIAGIGHGFQPIAGYNYGAGNKKRTREVFWAACLLGTAVCVLSAAGIAAAAGPIVGWFRPDPEVIGTGRGALLFVCAVLPTMAYSMFVNQLYQCLGFRRQATVLASCRQGILFIPLAYLLSSLLGLTGVQMIQPGADLLTFLVSIPFQIHFCRKYLS